MDTVKHKEKWEGKHKIRLRHTIYDTGNPTTGYQDLPWTRTIVGPIISEFVIGDYITFHAVYCNDKKFEEIAEEKKNIVMFPSTYNEIEIPI
jgi:hypothetical protein